MSFDYVSIKIFRCEYLKFWCEINITKIHLKGLKSEIILQFPMVEYKIEIKTYLHPSDTSAIHEISYPFDISCNGKLKKVMLHNLGFSASGAMRRVLRLYLSQCASL